MPRRARALREGTMAIDRPLRWIAVAILAVLPQTGFAADTGLITVPSKYPVETTVYRFEEAIRAKSDQGWRVFAQPNHTAAAKKVGLKLLPRTVILFGNPRIDTANMEKAPTLAIDLPPKALVWQDDHGKVWLTYNSGEYLQNYVYPRHGLSSNAEAAKAFDAFMRQIAAHATE
jgi:uncharacterized protein (DUF302 family)